MKNADVEFFHKLQARLNLAKALFGNNCEFSFEHHSGKDYWTIDFTFEYFNSKYSDCVVFHCDERGEDASSYDEILKDVEAIIEKAKLIIK